MIGSLAQDADDPMDLLADEDMPDGAPEEKCEVCLNEKWRYKCPRCGKKTCSLACVNEHKKESGCDGQRDVAKFVSKGDFTLRQLQDDYRFLMSAETQLDRTRRTYKHTQGSLSKAVKKRVAPAKPRKPEVPRTKPVADTPAPQETE
ncbi:HIT zinc finger [Carpediemonas membranifera]|uniref:Box C/D snoRNA protein 1 n=1 Tax=Carpediemonas membranifera TaxID=201153 RepID=A0A8J6DZF0_9EUKA|nr:HIT zinc finger [Carpediemonas membranifera]|eukprot:KAG9393534.1 HIT zinc finger [Carpediemonas membranifera]